MLSTAVTKLMRLNFRYFVLTGDDLEEWAQEPEAFHHEQEMVQWREKLRPCAESLYLALFERHREVVNLKENYQRWVCKYLKS